jgi:hypothetical protein
MQIKLTNGALIGSNGKPLSNKELAELVNSHRVATKAERDAERRTKLTAALKRSEATIAKAQKRSKNLRRILADLDKAAK